MRREHIYSSDSKDIKENIYSANIYWVLKGICVYFLSVESNLYIYRLCKVEQILIDTSQGPTSTNLCPFHLLQKLNIKVLEGTARYTGLLLAPGKGFGLRLKPRPFWPMDDLVWPSAKALSLSLHPT